MTSFKGSQGPAILPARNEVSLSGVTCLFFFLGLSACQMRISNVDVAMLRTKPFVFLWPRFGKKTILRSKRRVKFSSKKNRLVLKLYFLKIVHL